MTSDKMLSAQGGGIQKQQKDGDARNRAQCHGTRHAVGNPCPSAGRQL